MKYDYIQYYYYIRLWFLGVCVFRFTCDASPVSFWFSIANQDFFYIKEKTLYQCA